MNIILFDDNSRCQFLPLSHTRPLANMRCGILTIAEKWRIYFNVSQVFYKTEEYLQPKFQCHIENENIFVLGSVFPTKELFIQINALQENECIIDNDVCIAAKVSRNKIDFFLQHLKTDKSSSLLFPIQKLNALSDIFSMNEGQINADFDLLTKGKISQKLSSTNTLIGAEENIFLEEGAKVEASILNANTGKIYIGKNAEIMEGSTVRGPFALCDNAQLKMATKIYGATTIGDGCKVGGEVNNSVFFANSSKAHDGFVGNSVIGEWCNMGADSNNSNLKNNYEEVKLWSEDKNTFVKTGLQFCGLIMADHSKCGINTMFNTGTVVGVSANVFGAGFPRNFIPSFSWGGAQGFTEYTLDKAITTAEKVFARRNISFNEVEKNIFKYIFDVTKGQRNNLK